MLINFISETDSSTWVRDQGRRFKSSLPDHYFQSLTVLSDVVEFEAAKASKIQFNSGS